MNHLIWLSSLCVFVPSLFTTRMCSCVFYNFSLQSALVLDANIQSCTICLNFLIVVSSNQITKFHFVQVAISSFCKKKINASIPNYFKYTLSVSLVVYYLMYKFSPSLRYPQQLQWCPVPLLWYPLPKENCHAPSRTECKACI